MKSDVIRIDNQGNGFAQAVKETRKAGEYAGWSRLECLRLQLCAEEMLSLARSVTGEMEASFWLEGDQNRFELHMNTHTVMDMDKRAQLISASTARRNEAANTLLGRLRDAFEMAMMADTDRTHATAAVGSETDYVYYYPNEEPEWDGYERSVLRRVADDVKISIRGSMVEMTVAKKRA